MNSVHDALDAAERLERDGISRRGDRPAHAASARYRHDARLRAQDEPPRRRRGRAADRRLGRRGARLRHRAGARPSRRRVADRDAEHARSRTARRSKTRSYPGRIGSSPRFGGGYGRERGHHRTQLRVLEGRQPAPPGARAARDQPARARAPGRRLAEPRLADRARPRQPVGEHALRARHRARDDDERRLRRRRRSRRPSRRACAHDDADGHRRANPTRAA